MNDKVISQGLMDKLTWGIPAVALFATITGIGFLLGLILAGSLLMLVASSYYLIKTKEKVESVHWAYHAYTAPSGILAYVVVNLYAHRDALIKMIVLTTIALCFGVAPLIILTIPSAVILYVTRYIK